MDRATHGVLEIARSLMAELDLDVVLDRVLESARELTGARYAALGVLNADKTELERFVTVGIGDAEQRAIGSLPRGRGVLGELIHNPEPLRLPEVGNHPHSYGFPPGHPPMHTFVGVPIPVGGEPFGNLYLTEKEGGAQFSEQDEEALTMLADLAGVAIDHARRFTGSERRRDELERTVATLEATTQIARAVGAETDLDVILELVAKRGRALVSARTLVIEITDGGELLVASGAGELPEGLLDQRVAMRDTVASAALRSFKSQRIEDEVNRVRFDTNGLGQLGVDAKAGLVVPLIFQGRAYGVLIALDRLDRGPSFTAEDERLLEAFAASAAAAVATAQSVADERRRQRLMAAEAERGRWARELHDETLQGMAALRVGLSAARRSGRQEILESAVDGFVKQLDTEIANLRALITDLRPVALDELGPKAAIQALGQRALVHGVAVEVTVDLAYEGGRIASRHPPDVETAVYRIVQEALTNATKHGSAECVTVDVHEDDTTIYITVRDDGSGFDPTDQTEGFGLLGMRERVELLGGRLDVESGRGEGTAISAVLPARRRPAG